MLPGALARLTSRHIKNSDRAEYFGSESTHNDYQVNPWYIEPSSWNCIICCCQWTHHLSGRHAHSSPSSYHVSRPPVCSTRFKTATDRTRSPTWEPQTEPYCTAVGLSYFSSLYVAPFVATQIRPNFQRSIGNKKCTDALGDNYLELMWNSFRSSRRVNALNSLWIALHTAVLLYQVVF